MSDEDRRFYEGCVEITPDPVRRRTIQAQLEGLRRDIANTQWQLGMLKKPNLEDRELGALLARLDRQLQGRR